MTATNETVRVVVRCERCTWTRAVHGLSAAEARHTAAAMERMHTRHDCPQRTAR